MSESIVFFDGVCNLCNGFVDFLIGRDRRGVLRYASLQGETARKLLAPEHITSLESIVFYENGQVFTKSAAVIRILSHLGGIWGATQLLLVFPRPFRDVTYAWIAKNRYKFFGKRETCRLPTPEERARFLD